jgi:hypothetical protein
MLQKIACILFFASTGSAFALDPIPSLVDIIPPFGSELYMNVSEYRTGVSRHGGKQLYFLEKTRGDGFFRRLELEVDIVKVFLEDEETIPFHITRVLNRREKSFDLEIFATSKAGNFLGRVRMIADPRLIDTNGEVNLALCAQAIQAYYFCDPEDPVAKNCRKLEWD